MRDIVNIMNLIIHHKIVVTAAEESDEKQTIIKIT